MVVNVFLFDDFEAMDVFGPVQIFGTVPEQFYIRFISLRGGMITGKQGVKIWTEPLNPIEIEDIFLIPGGKGVRSFLHTEGDKGRQTLKQAVEEAEFCMMYKMLLQCWPEQASCFTGRLRIMIMTKTGSGCSQ